MVSGVSGKESVAHPAKFAATTYDLDTFTTRHPDDGGYERRWVNPISLRRNQQLR